MQETSVRFLGWGDSLEKGQATHSSILELPLVAQLVKNWPAMWDTWVWPLGWEDPLEKGKATHFSILVWRISWATVRGVTKSWTWLSWYYSSPSFWSIFSFFLFFFNSTHHLLKYEMMCIVCLSLLTRTKSPILTSDGLKCLEQCLAHRHSKRICGMRCGMCCGMIEWMNNYCLEEGWRG